MKKLKIFIFMIAIFGLFLINVRADDICGVKKNKYACKAQEGCAWDADSFECLSQADFCDVNEDRVSCNNAEGCMWDDSLSICTIADKCTECAANGTPCTLCGEECVWIRAEGPLPPGEFLIEGVGGVCFTDENILINKEKETDKGGCDGYNYPETCGDNKYYSCIWNGKDTCLEKETATCLDFKDSSSCGNHSKKAACVWVDKDDHNFLEEGYCNVDNLLYVSCGDARDIPVQVPSIISMLVNLLKIATPIILIIISMITLVKALAAGKEDEIKKATSSLVKKMIAAALVFFVVAIVQFVISKVAEDDEYEGFDKCLNCFLNNSCSENMYYKTVISGEEWCTDLKTGNSDLCNPKNSE